MPLAPLNNCTAAQEFASYAPLQVALAIQAVFSAVTLLIFGFVLVNRYKNSTRISYHGNLKLLAGVITFFYLFHSVNMIVNNVFLLIQRSMHFDDPCVYAMVGWMCLLQEGPAYAAMVGFTLCHSLIFVERCIAAFLVRTYESRGYGLVAAPIGLTMTFFILWNYYIFDEEDPWALRSHCTPTSPTNALKVANAYLALLAIDLSTTIGDLLLLWKNKRANRRKVEEYTLQKSYQLRENDVALKLILPVSMVHSAFYLIYLGVNNVLRHVFANSDAIFYVTLLEWMQIMVCAYTSAPLIAFYVFTRRLETAASRRAGDVGSQTEVYFRQFQQQLDGPPSRRR